MIAHALLGGFSAVIRPVRPIRHCRACLGCWPADGSDATGWRCTWCRALTVDDAILQVLTGLRSTHATPPHLRVAPGDHR